MLSWAESTHLVGRVLVLIQEHLELADADAQVPVGELVRDVEAQRAELPALDGVPVEQAEGEEQGPERPGLGGGRGDHGNRAVRGSPDTPTALSYNMLRFPSFYIILQIILIHNTKQLRLKRVPRQSSVTDSHLAYNPIPQVHIGKSDFIL